MYIREPDYSEILGIDLDRVWYRLLLKDLASINSTKDLENLSKKYTSELCGKFIFVEQEVSKYIVFNKK